MPDHRGMTPEQWQRMNGLIKRMGQSFSDMIDAMRYLIAHLPEVLQEVEAEAQHDQDQEADGFAAMLDNMTNKQIWRQIRGDN